jgi:hypothetical protein
MRTHFHLDKIALSSVPSSLFSMYVEAKKKNDDNNQWLVFSTRKSIRKEEKRESG